LLKSKITDEMTEDKLAGYISKKEVIKGDLIAKK